MNANLIRVATLVVIVTVMSATVFAQSTAGTTALPMLEVSGPTYRVDGEITGASVGRALKLREPIEVYQVSGKTLCASASATAGKPTDAGSGWRLTILPLRLGNEVLLSVDWQRLWERGETLTNGPKGRAVVTLQPGERILLDYITAGDLLGAKDPNQAVAFRPGDPDRPVVWNFQGCNAVGMGLQIGLPPVESQTFVEANLWLVRTLADGSERVWPQTVRIRTGTVAEFVFDEQTIALTAPKSVRGDPALDDARQALAELKARGVLPTHPSYLRLEKIVKDLETSLQKESRSTAERRVRTSGKLRSVGVSDGKVMMEVTLAQYLIERPGSVDRISGGSATFDLTAGPEEVVAFRLPQVADDAGRLGERMSVRIQVKAINQLSATPAQSTPTTAGRTDSAFITGEVRKPGPYPWVKGMTVLNLVAAAGGLLPSADRRVLIVSGTAKDERGQPLTYLVEFDDLIKGKNLAKNLVELQPSDTVIVRRAKGPA